MRTIPNCISRVRVTGFRLQLLSHALVKLDSGCVIICSVLTTSVKQIVHFSSKFGGAGLVPCCEIRLGDVDIQPSNVVRNLGVSMDSAATMSDHVINICKAASHAHGKLAKFALFLIKVVLKN